MGAVQIVLEHRLCDDNGVGSWNSGRSYGRGIIGVIIISPTLGISVEASAVEMGDVGGDPLANFRETSNGPVDFDKRFIVGSSWN